MANVSDVIEAFIMNIMGEEAEYNFNRSELASRFDCVPSQINYVLSTRFTAERGFVTTSRRGGGGSVTIIKLRPEADEVLRGLGELSDTDARQAKQIIEMLLRLDLCSEAEARIAVAAIEEAAVGEFENKNAVRNSVLRNIIVTILKGKE